jgi:hypothetical protein
VVFLIVVLLGVLAPLTAVPLVVDDYQTMLKAKWFYVILFLIVLGISFWYFFDLARWKADETDMSSKIYAALLNWLSSKYRIAAPRLRFANRPWSRITNKNKSDAFHASDSD